MKNYQEQLFITHARAHKHTSGFGDVLLNNKMLFKNEKSRFQN